MSAPARTTVLPSVAAIVEPPILARFWWLIRRSFVAAYQDNCFSIAKGAAYSFLLSLFPVLTALTSILIQVRAQEVVHVIATAMQQILPPGTEELILSRLRDHTGAKPISLPVAALLLSLWAGSGAMMSLMEGFQAAYRIPTGRPFVRQRLMAMFLVVIAAIPVVVASSLIIFGNRGEHALIRWIGVYPDTSDLSTPVRVAWRIARYVLAFCTTTFVTGLLYYFGPNHRPGVSLGNRLRESAFMRVWPGAFLATGLWLLATAGFAWYVGHRISNYNIVYGSIGAVVVLVIWLYLIACIALIGCEFNAERERCGALPNVVRFRHLEK